MMQTSCRISSGSEHSITSYAPQSQLFVDCFKFACKVSLLCGPTKSVILHYHLNLKIDSELHGHNRLRIKPFRVFSMEELGRLGTAWREKAIMVGRDSFFDLSTAYLEFNVTVALCLTQHHWFPAKCHDTSSSDFKFSPKRSYVSTILFVLDKILVGTSSLVAVGWAHHSEVGDETQRWNGLNGLMGRAILSNLSSSRSPTHTTWAHFP